MQLPIPISGIRAIDRNLNNRAKTAEAASVFRLESQALFLLLRYQAYIFYVGPLVFLK